MIERTGRIDSVLLIGFGGPERPADVMPFLRRVTEGRGVPEARLAEVAHHYDVIGGRSPYNEMALALAGVLASTLASRGRPLPVRTGMRNWHPFLADTLAEMDAAGLRSAAGVILAAYRCEASHDRYERDVAAAQTAGGLRIRVTYPPSWFDDERFLEAAAQRIEQGSGMRRGAWPADVPLIFTAHSIPEPMARAAPYERELDASCAGVAAILKPPSWRLAYQSASAGGRAPWLGPDITQVLRECAAAGIRQIVVNAIGFLTDHVEVLYDLDVEAAALARELGLTLTRTPCVGAHPLFVAMLADRILAMPEEA